MSRKVNQRSWKNYLINKNVQIRITVINLIYMVIAVILNTAVILSSSVCNIYYSGESGLWPAIDMYALSSEIFTFSLAAVFILAVINQITVTHQVCGPLVNFTNSFKKVAQGDLTRRVNLRSKDLLKEEASHFNNMVDELSNHIAALKADNQLLLSIIKELNAYEAGSAEIEKTLSTVKEREQQFNEHLSKLKLINEAQ